MPEKLGDAYVTVHADTRFVKRETERAFKRLGEQAGEDYEEGFARAIGDKIEKRLQHAFEEGFVSGDFSKFADQFGGMEESVKQFGNRVDVSSAATNRLRKQLRDMRADGLLTETQMKDLIQVVDTFQKRVTDTANARAIAAQDRAFASYSRNVEAYLTRDSRALDEQNKAFQSYAKNVQFSLTSNERALAAQNKAFESYGRNLLATIANEEKFAAAKRSQDFAYDTYSKNIAKVQKRESSWFRQRLEGFKAITDSVSRFQAKVYDSEKFLGRFARTSDKALKGIIGGFDRVNTDVVGSALGKGSRNNFFNAFGSSIKGITDLALAVGKFPLQALQKINETISGIGGGGGFNLETLNKVFGNLSTTLAAIIPIIAAVVTAFFALGAIVSIVSLLASAITSLSLAVAGALAGGLLALGPALLTIVATGAAAVLWAKNFDDSMNDLGQRLFDSFLPSMNKAIKVLDDLAKKNFDRVSKSIKDVFGPLTIRSAQALGLAATGFLNAFTSPTAASAFKKFGDSLNDISAPLGSIIGNLTVGLIGFFNAITPFTKTLLDNLDALVIQFNNWANSASGENSIASFMDQAFQSGQKVITIIGNIGEALFALFNNGGNLAGGDILDSLVTQTQNFVDYLNDPANQAAIGTFFSDGVEFARRLGTAIADLGAAFIALDTPENRAFAKDLVSALGEIGSAIVTASSIFDSMRQTFMTGIGLIVAAFGPLMTAFDAIKVVIGLVQAAWDLATLQMIHTWGGLLKVIGQALVTLGDFLERLGSVPGAPAWIGELGRSLSNAGQQAHQLGTEIQNIDSLSPRVTISVDAVYTKNAQKILSSSPTGRLLQAGGYATGGIVGGSEQLIRVAEGGLREAIVPLDRPLSSIDASVRGLAAIAQGKGNYATGGVVGRGLTIEKGAITVIPPYADSRQVASSVLDRLVGAFK